MSEGRPWPVSPRWSPRLRASRSPDEDLNEPPNGEDPAEYYAPCASPEVPPDAAHPSQLRILSSIPRGARGAWTSTEIGATLVSVWYIMNGWRRRLRCWPSLRARERRTPRSATMFRDHHTRRRRSQLWLDSEHPPPRLGLLHTARRQCLVVRRVTHVRFHTGLDLSRRSGRHSRRTAQASPITWSARAGGVR